MFIGPGAILATAGVAVGLGFAIAGIEATAVASTFNADYALRDEEATKDTVG